MMEKKQAGAGFLLIFFEDIENLKNAFVEWVNLWVNLQNKYNFEEGKEEEVSIDEEDKVRLQTIRENLRAFIIRTYINYKAIREMLKDVNVDDAKIEKIYNLAKEKLSIANRDKLGEYIMEMTKLFATGVLSDLLIQIKDIYGQVT